MVDSERMSAAIAAVASRRQTPEEACRSLGVGPAELADLALAGQLRESLAAELPSPTYWRALEGQLQRAQQQRSVPLALAPPSRRSWRSPLLGLTTAAVLALALGLATFVVAPPQPASAQTILTQARATAAGLANGRVRSFAMTLVASGPDDLAATPATPHPAPGTWRREEQTWYQAPDRWRSETRFLRRPDGSQDAAPSMLVADGRDIWSYDGQHHLLQVHPGRLGGLTKGGLGLYGAAGSLSAVLAQARCFPHPALAGTARVAGRLTTIIDLGPTGCPSNAAGGYNGDVTVWIDTQTYFVLKQVIHATGSPRVALTQEVTSIQYNLALPATLFTFTPPQASVAEPGRWLAPEAW